MKYPFVFYRDSGLESWQGGCVKYFLFIPFVLIRPKHREDEGLLRHELLHVWQHWLAAILSAVLLGAAGYAVAGTVGGVGMAAPIGSAAAIIGLYAHPMLYTFWAEYRLNCEVECYQEQLRYAPGREELFAGFIASRYKLHVTQDQAVRLLTENY